jgi:hypothetical protein
MSIIVRASESLHWYRRDGTPQYSVEAAKGGMRATTLRDARKMNLVPSVTTILKSAASPGLEAWKLNQMLLAALTLPRVDGESEESFVTRVVADSKEHAKMAAERGTRVHAAVEKHYEGVVDEEMSDYQLGVSKSIREAFGDLAFLPEKAFAHELGFGGKVDLHAPGVVLDIKSKEFTSKTLDKVEAYDEHMMQLAAYRVGLGMPEARCANVFASVTEPGLCKVVEWSQEDLSRGWTMFESLLKYWQAKNQHK